MASSVASRARPRVTASAFRTAPPPRPDQPCTRKTPASAEALLGPAASSGLTPEVTEPQQRGPATLLAEARELDTAAGDDALDLLDHAPGGLLARAETGPTPGAAGDLPGLDLAAQGQRHGAVKVLVGASIGRTVSREQPAAAV